MFIKKETMNKYFQWIFNDLSKYTYHKINRELHYTSNKNCIYEILQNFI